MVAKDSFGVAGVHPGLPFTVDTFAWNDCEKPQFVTHAHKDHAVDIEKYAADVWCTATTKELLLIRFPCLARARTTFNILQMPDPQNRNFREAMEDLEAQQASGRSAPSIGHSRQQPHSKLLQHSSDSEKAVQGGLSACCRW
jgi:ribonuclease BN (tRNA processing enzyme)